MDANVQTAAREIINDLDALKVKIANYAGINAGTIGAPTGGPALWTVEDREELLLLLKEYDADEDVIRMVRQNKTMNVTALWQQATHDQQEWWLENVCGVENIPGTSREILARWPNMPKPRD
jgi:hypothetical protein